MKTVWLLSHAVLVSLMFAGCEKPHPAVPGLAAVSACRVVLAADSAGDAEIAQLQTNLRQQLKARDVERLGYRFVAAARRTSDAGYYTVAEQAAFCLESLSPANPSAWLLRGHVLHQMHRFHEAETIARRLIGSREFVLDFGLLGDTLMEQGRLAEASQAYQKMIDLKPFYQSYVRASHLRWLKGDLTGAIEMMREAVQAASPRDPESIAWAYARLSIYQLQQGRLNDALETTGASLKFVSDYAPALLARGRIQLATGSTRPAVETLKRAARLNGLPEYQWALADALRLLNQNDEAAEIEAELVRAGAATDPRTMALFLATRQAHDATAVDLARRELARRQDVFTLDALAWALVSTGQIGEASALMQRALAEGTRDARLFLHASMIADADGRRADAARWRREATKLRFTLLPSEAGVLRRRLTTSPRT